MPIISNQIRFGANSILKPTSIPAFRFGEGISRNIFLVEDEQMLIDGLEAALTKRRPHKFLGVAKTEAEAQTMIPRFVNQADAKLLLDNDLGRESHQRGAGERLLAYIKETFPQVLPRVIWHARSSLPSGYASLGVQECKKGRPVSDLNDVIESEIQA